MKMNALSTVTLYKKNFVKRNTIVRKVLTPLKRWHKRIVVVVVLPIIGDSAEHFIRNSVLDCIESTLMETWNVNNVIIKYVVWKSGYNFIDAFNRI